MASPVDANRAATNISTAAAPWTVGFPAGVTAGQLLIMLIRVAGTQTVTNVTTSGENWTQLVASSADASDDNTYVYYWQVTTAAATSVTLSAAAKGAAIVWRVTGAADPASRTPEASTVGVFTTTANTANPPTISPTGGSKDYLFLALAGCDSETVAFTHSVYANLVSGNSGTGGAVATNCVIAGASRQATTATEDPAAFTHVAAQTGGATVTVAIHPAGPTTQFGVTSSTITLGKAVAATKQTFATVARATTVSIATAGTASAPGVTHYGATALPVAFGKATQGSRRTFGTVARLVAYAAATGGQRKTFGVTARPTVFGKAVAARKQTFGTVARPTTLTVATAGTATSGAVTHHGQVTAPFAFAKAVQATRQTFGVAARPTVFGKATTGRRKTFGVVGRPTTLGIATSGTSTAGPQTHHGQAAATFTLTRAVHARRQTFGQVVLPVTAVVVTNGTAAANRYGTIMFPVTITVSSSAIIVKGTVLNYANNIHLGTTPADKVYAGANPVWP